MSQPTITYFNSRGRAEVARLILELAGVPYTYHGVKDWNTEKAALLAKGVLTYGQLPLYQEGDFHIVQSQAINRYLAHKHGLVGSNAQETAKADEVAEGFIDLGGKYAQVRYYTAEAERPAAIKKFNAEVLPVWFAHFTTILSKNHEGKGFFVGNKITYADIIAFDMFWRVITLSDESKAELAKFPILHQFYDRIEATPKIAAYYAKDPYKQ